MTHTLCVSSLVLPLQCRLLPCITALAFSSATRWRGVLYIYICLVKKTSSDRAAAAAVFTQLLVL